MPAGLSSRAVKLVRCADSLQCDHLMPSAPTTDYFGVRTRLPLPAGTLVGVVVALLAVAATAYFIYLSLQTRRVAADLVSHTLEVLQEVDGVLSTLKDAETGQRGFLLTGEER